MGVDREFKQRFIDSGERSYTIARRAYPPPYVAPIIDVAGIRADVVGFLQSLGMTRAESNRAIDHVWNSTFNADASPADNVQRITTAALSARK